MRSNLIYGIALVVVSALQASPSMAQPTIGSVVPRSCMPGTTTRMTITGKGFTDPIRITTSRKDAKVEVASVEAEKLVIDVTLPQTVTLGPFGMWLASAAGPGEPFILLADDLPPISEATDNVSTETAQVVSAFSSVGGASKGPQGSFYKFDVAENQRVAFEVVTQAIESTMDPVLRLMDSDGNILVLADDDEVGPDCRFSYQFEKAGSYWVEIRDNRYVAGLPYHLRIGDFPILRHANPLAITAGKKTSIAFEGLDGNLALKQEIELPLAIANKITTVATKIDGGKSSAWVPIYVTESPVHCEAMVTVDSATEQSPLAYPVLICGGLAEPAQKDRFAITGVKGSTIRVKARGRSLGCPTTLKMRLLGEGDVVVAESKVADTDEWSFDFAVPEDRIYQLEVADLLGRGGVNFGYAVEVISAGTFTLNVKPDAAARQVFALENGHGAMAIDLQVQRFGYAGEIDVSIVDPPLGLRILNPRIAGNANDARIFVMVDQQWNGDAHMLVNLRGEATGNPAIAAQADSLALQRVKTPHVPFPVHWKSGAIVLSGVAATDAFFALEPAAPIRFARPVPRHETTLNLKRIQEAFKTGLVVMADPNMAGWPLEIKNEADVYTAAWVRPADSPIDLQAQPQSFTLLTYGEHQNRARIAKIDVPVEWFDPAVSTIKPLTHDVGGQSIELPLVAGAKGKLKIDVVRDGDDPQPITLTFAGAAELGMTVPESLVIAADQASAEIEVAISGDYSQSSATRLPFVMSSTYKGQAYQVNGQSVPVSVIAAPQSIEVFPTEVLLSGVKDRHQIVVTGYDEIKTPRDWSRDASITIADPAIAEVRGTALFAKANGETKVIVKVGAQVAEIPVRVTGTDVKRPIAFENEVLVALSKQGCNSGACHGSPSGKGMFRLSLRAFDRKLDELTLVREDYGRRLNPIEPDQSLLLLKPLMKVSHGGGKQLKVDDEAYTILRDWIAEGSPADPADAARCIRLEVLPNTKRVLRLEAGPQQVAAIAHFSDGTKRDVTHLVAYESSDLSVATVDQAGLVTPMKRGETVILVRFLEHIESVPLMFIQQVPNFVWQSPVPSNYVDELVNDKLRQLQYVPSETCTDAEFLRRAYLDLIGILPTVDASRAFLADGSSDKRSRLIDELLNRDEFAKFWALKWGDLLKMTGKVVGDDGVYKYHRWVEEAFRTNMPYDEFATQLLTTSGSTLANPPANFYRTATDMNECVENVSQVFLGARLQCAKCHNHPFERWTQDNYYGLGAFFNRVERRKTERPGEMFVWTSASGDVVQPRTGEKMKPWLPVRGSIDVSDSEDRRDTFAQWLVEPSNPYFSKMEVNRIWAQLFARGIVDPIDDFRDSNPPSNEALLDALAADFVQAGFDRKHILRVILNSRTYQSSYQTSPLNQDDTQYFSHQRPRLLGAEQLLDAINHATGLDQKFGNLPPGTRATHLPAPDVVKVDFLRVFGQPERTTVCACERVDDSNLGMAIELFNGTTIHDKLRDPNTRFRAAIAAGRPVAEVIQEVYLAALCRLPTAEELKAATDHCEKRDDVAAGLEDVCWALLNTDEFLFQH